MRTLFLLFLFILRSDPGAAATLRVGAGHPYPTLQAAAAEAVPGDTILIHQGIYPGGVYIESLQGTADAWISIFVADGDIVIFEGGTNAWQFTDAAYLHIRGFVFRGQTGNGVNFDDGGTYETPAHHVIFETCEFRDIHASGNNDLLKLSGVDSFEVRSCQFLNGAAGGSGIDMVGCHDGIIRNCAFGYLGSNSIQAKGGTRNIRIVANFFKDGGARAVNLGGSTGLAFFRPLDAPYEAADLKVYSNIFMGSEAPIAFVGTIGTEVINNTIFLPGKWVLRILQETVDPDRFAPCGQNTFSNNILYIDDQVSVTCNIGPNTAPETFSFSHNLWYHSQDGGWPGPALPVIDSHQIVGMDPLFESPTWDGSNFILRPESPAIGRGKAVGAPVQDFLGFPFLVPPSIGAIEGGMATSVEAPETNNRTLRCWPNPAHAFTFVHWPAHLGEPEIVWGMLPNGTAIRLRHTRIDPDTLKLYLPEDAEGVVYITVSHGLHTFTSPVIVFRADGR